MLKRNYLFTLAVSLSFHEEPFRGIAWILYAYAKTLERVSLPEVSDAAVSERPFHPNTEFRIA